MGVCEYFEEDRDPPLGIQFNGESRHAGQHHNWALYVFLRPQKPVRYSSIQGFEVKIFRQNRKDFVA